MDSTPLFKEDHRPALASAAAEYSKDRSAGNHRVLMSILSRCFQDGTHLTISYEPCEDENYSRLAMVEVHGKHFLLLFIHPEDFKLKVRRIMKGDLKEIDNFYELIEVCGRDVRKAG